MSVLVKNDKNVQKDSIKCSKYLKTSLFLRQLDMLRNQQEKMAEVCETRKEDIKTISNSLEGVTDNLRRMRTSIDRAADELEMHEPIGTDVNAIKRLQDELRVGLSVESFSLANNCR